MTKDLITVSENDKLNDFKKLFKAKGFHHILVENSSGQLVGIISSEDVYKAENYTVEDKLIASNLMTRSPDVLNKNESIAYAISIFLKQSYRALPIVNKKNDLVGILTPYDILRFISK